MQVYALDILFQTPMPFYVFRALLTVTNVDFVYDIVIPFAINIIIVSGYLFLVLTFIIWYFNLVHAMFI